MIRSTSLIALSLFASSLFVSRSSAQVLESDSLALVALYNATDGPNWEAQPPTVLPPWLIGPVSTWHSVTVTGNRVTSLYTEFIRLKGELPPELGDLTALDRLVISHDHEITGTIPPELGNLVNLEVLGLFGTSLTGSIPASLGSLPKLDRLLLPFNNLTGPIPPELGNLTSLHELDLNENMLQGTVPVEIGNMTALHTLYMNDNPELYGELPRSFLNLQNLRSLSFDNTQICGPLDAAFQEWLQSVAGISQGSCPVNNEDVANVKREIELRRNYPNPFSSNTTISFKVAETGPVELTVYNVLGELVETLESRVMTPGNYDAGFDASGLATGIYFYTLASRAFSQTRKMVVVR